MVEVVKELQQFIEAAILPCYDRFDAAHQRNHVIKVIEESMVLAHGYEVDPNMVYAIAAYHDLGLEGPRAVHHITSGKILATDRRLQKWFSSAQLNVMKEAVEDHRASASHAPRSIYGKIVAEADRDLDPETVIRRTIDFGLNHYPEKDKEEHWQRFMEHMSDKYSEHGYIRLWMPHSPNESKLKEIRQLINTPAQLREIFNKLYEEETH